MYKVDNKDGAAEDLENSFVVPRHGNASKPLAGPYYRTDQSVLKEITKNLEEGRSCDSTYKKFSLPSFC